MQFIESCNHTAEAFGSISSRFQHLPRVHVSDIDRAGGTTIYHAYDENGVYRVAGILQASPELQALEAAERQAEIDRLAAEAAALAQADSPLAALKTQATNAVNAIDTFLAIASPTNAQLVVEIRNIDQRQKVIINTLVRLLKKLYG